MVVTDHWPRTTEKSLDPDLSLCPVATCRLSAEEFNSLVIATEYG